MKVLKLFKIRRKSDGLFSTGGSKPRFTSVGKLWRKQHINSHLSMLKSTNRSKPNIIKDVYAGCEVVSFNLTEEGSEDMNEYAASNFKLR